MNSRRLVVASLPTDRPNKYVEVAIAYLKGGINMSNEDVNRGYYLSVIPVEQKGMFRVTGAMTGYNQLIERTGRFNPAKLEALQKSAPDLPFYQDMINAVLKLNNLTLVKAA